MIPRLSIIIPAYNAGAFLPECLDSIFCQQYTDYEVLCIDDGSIDSTPELLRQYAERYANLRVFTQHNHGMSAARNWGLKEAKGEYVLFVDSDDWLCKGSLSKLVVYMDGVDVVCFNAKKYIEKTGTYWNNIMPSVVGVINGWDYFNRVRLTPSEIHFVCIWQRAYRRSFLENNNLYFEEEVRRAEDDLFTTMVMFHAQTVKTINDYVYVYRIRANSITTTVDINRWYDSLKVQVLLTDFFVPLQGLEKSIVYRVLASNYINLFSISTVSLYGNHDWELKKWIRWDYFKEVCITPRHKRLYWLIRISPKLFRVYEYLMSLF